MVNWTKPTETDSYLDILDWARERDEHIAKLDFTGDSNVPTDVVRYDGSSNKFQRHAGSNSWSALAFHAAIDNHIGDTALHESFKTGDLKMAAYATPTTGWLLCNGAPISRTTYSTLFAKIGTTYGAGDSSSTFNLPNFTTRMPIGAGGSVALGASAGSWDHSHSVSGHTHTVASHAHTMKNHTHQVGSHTHSVDTHSHTIPAHGHSSQQSLATIQITSSGAHSHTESDLKATSTGSGSVISYTWNTGSGTASSTIIDSLSSGHTHGNSAFTGTVGKWDGGVQGKSGDADFTTTSSSLTTTAGCTAFNTLAPSDNTTDGTSLTTDTGGSGATGSGNPPVIGIYFFIKT